MIQSVNSTESLSGVVLLPGDKSISHRYAMIAAIAEGTSIIVNLVLVVAGLVRDSILKGVP